MTTETAAPNTVEPSHEFDHGDGASSGRSMGVGVKIYLIVGLCLALLGIVASVAIWQMNKIGTEIEAIAEQDMPLTSALTNVTIHQLEQAVQFERAFRFGEEMITHPETRKAFEKSSHEFEVLNGKVEKEIRAVEVMAEKAVHSAHTDAEKAEFTKIGAALKKIEAEHKQYDTIATQALKLVADGKIEEALKFEHQIVEIEDKLNHETEAVLLEITSFTATSAKTAEIHEQFAIKLLIGISLAALALGAFVSSLLVRSSITKPLNAVVGAVDSLTKGDLDVEITARANDEIGAVAKALGVFKQSMIDAKQLAAKQHATEQKAQELERQRQTDQQETERKEAERKQHEAAEREARNQKLEKIISAFDMAIGTVVDTLSSATTEMQSSAETMSATAEQTSLQASAVAAASEEASTNVQTVASAAEELSASIEEINRQVSQSNTIAQGAVEEAKQTNEKVEGLAQSAQKIGDVVNLINDIASQTNLLALNATIEAARAGEAGKGFAVVASEVKSLATQTSKATEEIGAQIVAIQASTSEAVQAIQGIGSTIGEIGEIATSVATAVEEQGSATREIAGSVQQAAAGTQEVSSNITQVTQAASENQSASGQMLDAAKELAKQGDVLRNEVNSFLESVRAA